MSYGNLRSPYDRSSDQVIAILEYRHIGCLNGYVLLGAVIHNSVLYVRQSYPMLTNLVLCRKTGTLSGSILDHLVLVNQ